MCVLSAAGQAARGDYSDKGRAPLLWVPVLLRYSCLALELVVHGCPEMAYHSPFTCDPFALHCFVCEVTHA